ncbi:hypothetical protein M758_5G081400 [Ceratodon purpureus]|nr:hypothetical protein M758_5G081400 [Ceratodon purpureus]KAG0615986.1 hypothetical protein M758_5G081400 [Ceratodon purpureus]
MAASVSSEEDRERRIKNSGLYFDVSLDERDPVVYSSSYNISFMGIEKLHPFDASKWGRIQKFLADEGVLNQKRIVEPVEATTDDLLVVHTEKYLDSLRRSLVVAQITEVPPVALLPNFIVQRKVLQPFRKQVGGTVLSAKLAKERGWAINIGGGFHHCCANEGGGFCAYADITLAIQFAYTRLAITRYRTSLFDLEKMFLCLFPFPIHPFSFSSSNLLRIFPDVLIQYEKGAIRVMIIDLDAHQGNGHERDFMNDGNYLFISLHIPILSRSIKYVVGCICLQRNSISANSSA